MIHLKRTNSEDADFQSLVVLLDQDLKIRDGEDHAFYAQFNKVASIRHVVVAYVEGKAVGCGAFKEYSPGVAEVKRMFVLPEYRGKGIALTVLKEVEQWADASSYTACMLETGMNQPEAIRLYEKAGYTRIQNYGQYEGVENSVCMQKELGLI